MKIVYIAHPISGNVQANLKDLRRIIRFINMTEPDIVPCCPYYADIVSLDDNIPEERERGIKNDIELLNSGMFSEMWLTGNRVSAGMAAEAVVAGVMGMKVVDYINKL